jgi:hypothetical protein
MGRDVIEHLTNGLQNRFRVRMVRIEPAEGMGQLGKTDRRMVAGSEPEQAVDIIGAAATEHIDIDSRIEHQRAADGRLARCPGQI